MEKPSLSHPVACKPAFEWITGPVAPESIAEWIALHGSMHHIGACELFLGQVRDDIVNDDRVAAIEYTAYTEMANARGVGIWQDIMDQYALACLHIRHSLGVVPAGGISLCVLATSAHRQAARDACREVVERIKHELPVWGKERLHAGHHRWKENQ